MENEKLELANKQAYNRLKSDGVPVKGGKTYLMVVHRIEILRNVFGLELGIKTELIHHDSERVIVSAKIIDCNGMIYGSGLAEEYRNDGNVNATSAVENAESSAIGRALASLGLHGGEYPTADEMNKALNSNRKSMKEPIAKQQAGIGKMQLFLSESTKERNLVSLPHDQGSGICKTLKQMKITKIVCFLEKLVTNAWESLATRKH